MLRLESQNANYAINVPTDEKEIDKKVLNNLLSNVSLPQYYCVVALRYRVSLFDLTITSKSATKKQQTVSVVPLMGKFNEGEPKVNVEVGQRILIDGSDIERGSHLNVNTVITPDRIATYIGNDSDLSKNVIARKLGDGSPIFCLEFKIVPITAIKGVISGKSHDPFIENIKSEK